MQDLTAVVIVVCVIGFVAGVIVIGHGLARALERTRHADAASWSIAALPEATRGRVVGAVAASARAAVAPLSGRPCVYYRVRVSELRARSGLAPRHHLEWVPIIDEQFGVEFLLDDGSGRLRIDPTDAAIELRAARTRITGVATAMSRHEEALLRRHRVPARDGLGMPRRLRFEEVALEIGQRVAAVGCGERDAAESTTDLWGLRPTSSPLRMTAPLIRDDVRDDLRDDLRDDTRDVSDAPLLS